MKRYINTYQVRRDMANGKLSQEEGEKILAEMHATAQQIRRSTRNVERDLERGTRKLDKSLHNFEKSMDRFLKNLDREQP